MEKILKKNIGEITEPFPVEILGDLPEGVLGGLRVAIFRRLPEEICGGLSLLEIYGKKMDF